MKSTIKPLFRNTFLRYLFAIATVATTFAFRIWLVPLTGTGAPFVLFFAAILVTSLFAGIGPGTCALLISLPLAAHTFVTRAGYTSFQAAFQALLFGIDGIVVIYLTFLITKANQETTRSMARIREVIELSPDAFFQADLQARFTDVNEAACRLLGYDRDELIGKTIFDIIRVEDASRLEAVRAEILLPGQVSRADWNQKRKDGTFVSVEVSSNILPDGRWQAFVRDISGRKSAEAALKDSERRLSLALDSAQMGMWDLDLVTDTSVRSLRHDQIFGYSAPVPTWGAAIFLTHVVPEDRDVAKRAFERAFESDQFEMECRILWPDKSIHWISAKGCVYRNPKGDPVRMMGTVLDITEHRWAEEAVKRSEREFRELAEAMPQIVWATTADGLNIYFNQRWVDYTGLTLEESHGEGWIIPFHPDDRQRAWDAWQRATQRRGDYSLECRLRRADGVYQWWLIRGVPLLGATGEISKWFGTCTDIEQIKVAEQRLKESEAKFSGIISISADAIISVDDAQRITIYNDGAEKIFGYSKSEAIGAPLDILIPDRLRGAHRRHVEAFGGGEGGARRMGESLTTTSGLRKNGEEFPAEAAISKLQVGEGTLLTVALRDITERKRMEKEQRFLAEAGKVLGSTLDYEQTLVTLAQLVVRDFADWCIVDIVDEHEQFRRLKVASSDPATAALCTQFEQIPINRDRPYLLRSVIETKQPLVIEHLSSEHLESVAQSPEHLQVLRAVSPRSLMALPLLMRGQLLGALAFIFSTTSRTYGPGDLPVGEAIADRAAGAIENARLYRASVHAANLRDQVLAVVAHDLRNPLSTILTQAWALKRQGAEPERRSSKPGDVIQRAAKRMNRLIQDLLDVARMEAGQLTIGQARLSAGALIIEAVDMQRSLASASSLELRVEVDPDVPEIWGDTDRLLQVFENLIGNAIKFTNAGGRITVGAALSGDEVVFRVEDTGRGIAFEDLGRVFDRFWQASRAGRLGAGLGLPIIKGIVEAHGGRVWVESTAGSGSTFFFTIPTASAAQDTVSDHPRSDRVA